MGLTDPCMNFDIFTQLYEADRKLQLKKKSFTMNMYKDLFDHTCVYASVIYYKVRKQYEDKFILLEIS